ncbi:MAG: EAL domain-containing protein [Methylomarinum sp.]|nr:EAL domain-containing protein [Methylomarinum sp.]
MPENNPKINKRRSLDILSELTRLTYASVPTSLLAVLINSSILGFMQWDVVSHTTILIWFAVTNGLSLSRLWLFIKFRKLDSEQPVASGWYHLTVASGVVSGATWGAAAIWLFPTEDIVHQTFLAFVLAGMCAGAASTLSPIILSLIGFLLMTMVPLIVQFLLVGTPIAYAMCVMSVLFMMMIMTAARRLNMTLKESVVMRHEQELSKEVIFRQAQFDELTDLPNRRMIMKRLKQDLSHAVRHNHTGAMLFLDLDHFKTINDSLGHAIGDELLKEVSKRIQKRLRDEDVVGRLGGDEFVIIMSEVGDTQDEASANAQDLAEGILNLFADPFIAKGHELHIAASIGVVLFPLADYSPEDLLQKSDVAMYEAKAAGRNKIRFFLPEMQHAVDNRRIIEKGLRQALKNNEFVLHYQPLVDIDSKMFAVEALIRWKHPERGLLPPDEFISIAEKCGLIIAIGDWVLKTACQQLMMIPDKDLKISVNVSPRQFVEANFVDKVKSIFAETGIDPTRVSLEITEGMILSNMDKAVIKMKDLSAIGVSLSIDDFGIGYSSLAYLKRFPVKLLKIDKSFVRDINIDPNDAIIVETIISMAKHLRMDVIAEGVEDELMLAALKRKGCHKFQGYFFGRPMPIEELQHDRWGLGVG